MPSKRLQKPARLLRQLSPKEKWEEILMTYVEVCESSQGAKLEEEAGWFNLRDLDNVDSIIFQEENPEEPLIEYKNKNPNLNLDKMLNNIEKLNEKEKYDLAVGILSMLAD